MATRIYRVTDYATNVRLVRAGSRAQAIGHVARSVYTVRVATQDDIVESMEKHGLKVEDAKAEPAGQDPAPE